MPETDALKNAETLHSDVSVLMQICLDLEKKKHHHYSLTASVVFTTTVTVTSHCELVYIFFGTGTMPNCSPSISNHN